MTALVALVRHTRPRIADGICYGRLDVGLHPEGVTAITVVGAALSSFAGTPVWTSPARRCRDLAEHLSAAPTTDPRLLELDFGLWEGQPWAAIACEALDCWALDPLAFAAPDGESGAALVARVSAFHRMLRRRRQDCVVVSHGGPLKVLRALLAGEPVDLLARPLAWGEVVVLPLSG